MNICFIFGRTDCSSRLLCVALTNAVLEAQRRPLLQLTEEWKQQMQGRGFCVPISSHLGAIAEEAEVQDPGEGELAHTGNNKGGPSSPAIRTESLQLIS